MTALGGADRVRARVEAIFDEDSRAWGLSRRSALAIAAFPVLMAAFVAAAHSYHPLYRFLTAEDSVLEWSQVALVLATSGFLFLITLKLIARREGRWAILFALGAIGAFVVAGEEISWGQRLFGIATPAEFLETNTQGETNLHNVRGALVVLNFATMVVAGFFAVAPLALVALRMRGIAVWSWIYRMVPPLALITAFVIPAGYRAARFVTARGTSGSFAELVEFCLYFGLAAFALLLYRRIAAEPVPFEDPATDRPVASVAVTAGPPTLVIVPGPSDIEPALAGADVEV